MSIAAVDDAVTEGIDVDFELTRNGLATLPLIADVLIAVGGEVLDAFEGTRLLEVAFEAGQSTAFLTLSTVNDLDYEAHVEVTATLQPSSRYTVSSTAGAATVTVSDNDVPETDVALEVAESVAESAGTLGVRIRARTVRDDVPHRALTVLLTSVDGTAVSGDGGDFAGINASVRFAIEAFERVRVEAEGEGAEDEPTHVHVATATRQVTIHEDAVSERDERFTLRLRRPSGVPARVRLPDDPSVIAIVDNDVPARTRANSCSNPSESASAAHHGTPRGP